MSNQGSPNTPDHEKDVHVLEGVIEAFNSGDIARIIALTHPEFEGVVAAELSTEPDSYKGHDGVRRYFETFEEVFDEICFTPERFWDAGGGVVVAAVRLTAKGRQTAIPVEQRNAQVWTLREGKAIRVMAYASLPEALAAAGLPARLADEAA